MLWLIFLFLRVGVCFKRLFYRLKLPADTYTEASRIIPRPVQALTLKRCPRFQTRSPGQFEVVVVILVERPLNQIWAASKRYLSVFSVHSE